MRNVSTTATVVKAAAAGAAGILLLLVALAKGPDASAAPAPFSRPRDAEKAASQKADGVWFWEWASGSRWLVVLSPDGRYVGELLPGRESVWVGTWEAKLDDAGRRTIVIRERPRDSGPDGGYWTWSMTWAPSARRYESAGVRGRPSVDPAAPAPSAPGHFLVRP